MTYKSYIYKNRHNTYYFRIVIPKDLRHRFKNKREIRRSLRTDSRSAAFFQARFLWVEFQKVFNDMSNKKKDEYLSIGLITYADAFGDTHTVDFSDPVLEAEFVEKQLARKEKTLLENPHLREGKNKTEIDELNNEISRLKELIGKPYASEEELETLPMSELIDAYVKDQASNWKKRTSKDYRNALNVFKEIVGDININDFNKKAARTYKTNLLVYPFNRTKGKLADKPLQEIISAGEYKTISASTANKNFTRASTFINWCNNHGYGTTNPLTGMAPKVPKEKPKRSFNTNELDTIFSHDIFTKKKYKNDWQYWLPILAYATGARIQELCQLYKTDIKEKNGLYYFDIIEQEGTKLKNKASNRRLPVHHKLIELGFIEFVNSRGSKRIFALDHYKSDRLSTGPGKWFSRFKTKLGFDGTVSFHSFRHTIRDMLSEADVPGEKIKAILGHEQGDETFGTYGSAFKPEQLNQSIQILELPELEKLTQLRTS